MEYIGIGICVIAVVAICIFIVQRKKHAQEANSNENVKTNAEECAIAVSNDTPTELVIEMEMLPAEAIKDENALVEITDSKVLAHVNNLVPGLVQAGNAANNAAQAVQAANGGVLYRAIIPAGAKLTDSKAMEGAVRGFYRGADGIQGHANLVAVEAQKGTALVANTAAAAMGVASMVVGQYYMTQINAELGAISDGISEIQNFQDNEYRSRVFSLVAHVKKIADFQTEILENNELRISKINQLDSLEEEVGDWSLNVLDEEDIQQIPQFDELIKNESGTLVVWQKLDRLKSGEINFELSLGRKIDRVRDHLSLVYHRYLAGESGITKLKLSINGEKIKGIDPFLTEKSVQAMDDETLVIQGNKILVRPYILPHISKLTSDEIKMLGGKDGLRKQQGFYVYRNKRLLVWGTWFRMMRQGDLGIVISFEQLVSYY